MHDGEQLGPVGGRIVGEVLVGIIDSDPGVLPVGRPRLVADAAGATRRQLRPRRHPRVDLLKERGRRQLGLEARLLAGDDVRRHRADELAERGRSRFSGEQRAALQPGGELGLQVEPDAERGVAEHVVDDAKLVDDSALLAAEQRMRLVAGDRRERHRPAFSELGAELHRAAVGLSLAAAVADLDSEGAAGEPVEARGVPFERAVRVPDRGAVGRGGRREPVGDPLGERRQQEARRPEHMRGRRSLTRVPIDLELGTAPGGEDLVRLGRLHTASLKPRRARLVRTIPAGGP